MMKDEFRALRVDELEAVSGSGQVCADLPGIRVCYNWGNDNNGPTWGDIYNAWAQRGRDLDAGQTKF
jgi:hypothetical protein